MKLINVLVKCSILTCDTAAIDEFKKRFMGESK